MPKKGSNIWCAAPNCNHSRNKGWRLFRFPRNEARCRQWMQNCLREDLQDRSCYHLSNNCFLCVDHFEDDQFWNASKKAELGLLRTAVPTLFNVPSPPTKRTATRALPDRNDPPPKRSKTSRTELGKLDKRPKAHDTDSTHVELESSALDMEVNCRPEAASVDLDTDLGKPPHRNAVDSGMTLRKAPTLLKMKVSSLREEPSVMDVETKGEESSTIVDLGIKMSERPVNMSLDSMRREQTVVMFEDSMNRYREHPLFDAEMSTKMSRRTDTLMSLGNEQSVMDTSSQIVDSGMRSERKETLIDFKLNIKQELSEMEGDLDAMKESAPLETSMSVKTEQSFFDIEMAHDDSVLPATRGVSSVVGMSQQSSFQRLDLVPGMSTTVEDTADYIDTPVPLLHARYTVKSEPPSFVNTSSVRRKSGYKQKLIVKFKHKITAKHQPYSQKAKRPAVNPKRKAENIPGCSTDAGVVIKCEPLSDVDLDLDTDQNPAEESLTAETKLKKTLRRERTHPSPICSLCQQLFCSRSSLKRHFKRMHTTESLPFTCSFCDAKFAQLFQRRAHERSHRGEKTFPCQECDVVCTRPCHLRVHMRKHTGERPYICSMPGCSATFRCTSNLNRHMMKHTGLKPYVCTVCNSTFYQASHLRSHIRKHTGERPFTCKRCDASFAQLTHLDRHMARHTGKKPHVCDTCGVAFVEKCALKRHVEGHQRQKQGKRPYRRRAVKRASSKTVKGQSLNTVQQAEVTL